MNIRPFPWAGLSRVDRADMSLVARLSFAGRSEVFSEALSKAFEVPCKYEHARAAYHPPGFVLPTDDGFVARVTTVPENRPLYVWVPAASCGLLLQRLFDDQTPRGSRLSEPEWGAMAYVALTMLKAAMDAGLPPMRLEANPPPDLLVARDFGREPTIESVIVFRGEGLGRNYARLLIPLATARELAHNLSPQMYFGDAVGRAKVPFAVTKFVDYFEAEDVRRLAPGDVIFLADSLDELFDDVQFRTTTTRVFAKILPQEDRFDVQVLRLEEADVANATADEATTQLSTALVEVEVKLGSIQISLAELGAMGPGAVFALSSHPGEPIELLVAGQAIAQAELVLVGDRVGCRVVRRLR